MAVALLLRLMMAGIRIHHSLINYTYRKFPHILHLVTQNIWLIFSGSTYIFHRVLKWLHSPHTTVTTKDQAVSSIYCLPSCFPHYWQIFQNIVDRCLNPLAGMWCWSCHPPWLLYSNLQVWSLTKQYKTNVTLLVFNYAKLHWNIRVRY